MEEREDGGEFRSKCERGMAHLAGFEDGEGVHKAKECRWSLEAGESKKKDSPLEITASKRTTALPRD